MQQDYLAINLLVSLKNVALERVVGDLSSDVTEDLEILGVMGHIENPAKKRKTYFIFCSHSLSLSLSLSLSFSFYQN